VTADPADAIKIGATHDGSDYYAILSTGGAASLIDVDNSTFNGNPMDAHAHGIVTQARITQWQVQNSTFQNLNEALAGPEAAINSFTGNISRVMTTASTILTGTDNVVYGGNFFQIGTLQNAVVSGCGMGATAIGATSGIIQVGTGGTTTCTLTLPWVPSIGFGACTFTPSTQKTLSATATATAAAGAVWTVTASAPMFSGEIIKFNCPGG
jgi:hypothetical protein